MAARYYDGVTADVQEVMLKITAQELLICRLAQLPSRKADFEKQLNDILKNPGHPYFQQAKNLQKDLNK